MRSWTHDALGRLRVETDENDNTTEYDYDAVGRLTTVTDAEGRVTTYTYDPFGNLASQTDARTNVTLYEHDVMGRRTAKELPLGQREVKTYTPLSGQLAAHWPFGADASDPLDTSEAITYEYEVGTDRLMKIVHPDDLEIEYGYRPDGSVASVTRREPFGGPVRTTLHAVDSRGRPWRDTHHDGSVIEHAYDETGFRTSVTVYDRNPDLTGAVSLHELEFEADARGRLAEVVENSAGTARYTYEGSGQVKRIDYYSSDTAPTAELSVVHDWQRDPRPRLEQLLWTNSAATTVAQIDYVLDPAGHREHLSHQGMIGQRTIQYDYDTTYRLGMETHRDGPDPQNPGTDELQIEYQYDPVGNRTRRIDRSGPTLAVDADTISSYDDNDRLLSAGISSYGWDDRGRLISENDGTDAISYNWADDDRLLSVLGGATNVYYSYDGEQRLIERTAGSNQTEKLIVDSGFQYAQTLVEYTGDLAGTYTTEAKHVFGHRLLGEKRGATTDWAVTDALGSVRGLVAAGGGTFTGPWGYEAYGPEYETQSADLTHRFAGERRDAGTNSDYLRARWMLPDRGGFQSRDPFEGRGDAPVSRHSYAYAGLRPGSHTDPSGRESFVATQVKLVGAGIVVGAGFQQVSHLISAASGEPVDEVYRRGKRAFLEGFIFGYSLAWAEVFAVEMALAVGGTRIAVGGAARIVVPRITITERGIALIERHLASLDALGSAAPYNSAMIARLRAGKRTNHDRVRIHL